MVGGLAGLLGSLGGEEYIAWRRHLKGAGGVSVGSIIALGVTLGVDLQRLVHIMRNFPFADIFKNEAESWTGILRDRVAQGVEGALTETLWSARGVMAGNSLLAVADSILCAGGAKTNVTFGELFEATGGFDFRVVATDVQKMKPVVFSAGSTPNVEVVFAMAASMSIPVMFAPRRIPKQGHFVDGAIADCYGILAFEEHLQADNVLIIAKNLNLHGNRRHSSMATILMECLALSAQIGLRMRHVKMASLIHVLVGVRDGTDDTQASSWADLFSTPPVREMAIDGALSSDLAILLIWIIVCIVFANAADKEQTRRAHESKPASLPAASPLVGHVVDAAGRDVLPEESGELVDEHGLV